MQRAGVEESRPHRASGLENTQYVRSLFGTLLNGELVKDSSNMWPIVCLTDCNPLHNHLHQAGVPQVPADRRLAIDLAALRLQLCEERRGSRLPAPWIIYQCNLKIFCQDKATVCICQFMLPSMTNEVVCRRHMGPAFCLYSEPCVRGVKGRHWKLPGFATVLALPLKLTVVLLKCIKTMYKTPSL